jgi:glycosyltransferase involved in cell wall biosynthesis
VAPPPDVSVIIPTRNRVGYLQKAVASVFAQRDVDVEILVVDDGAGVPVFEDRRVLLLDNFSRGPVAARILGIEIARADVVAFLDDDDWWHSNVHLSTALASIHSGADFTFANGVLSYEDGTRSIPFSFDADADTLSRDNTILISAVCYRRALHAKLGPFDMTLPYYWDWDWYLRVARSGAKLERMPESAVTIRVHADNMSGEYSIQARRKNLDALAAKHGLGHIELKNHESLARGVNARR